MELWDKSAVYDDLPHLYGTSVFLRQIHANEGGSTPVRFNWLNLNHKSYILIP